MTDTKTRTKILFVIAFIIFGVAALHVPLSQLVGSKASFTLFDAFAPIAGAFLGTIPGALAVVVMQGFNFVAQGANFSDMGALIRIVPVIFAAIYFSRKMPLNVVVPMLAIAAWVMNPVGREVWYYSLMWLIPILCYFLQERFLFTRALGATFTAHAVGGALWVWFIPLPAVVWASLIPVVLVERFFFAAGIAAAYVAATNALAAVNEKLRFAYKFPIQHKYVFVPSFRRETE
ncbi:hypothetical protein COU20_04025 [Candidatus Kaiserbacteria bacterium CG10_big_fil_rev_8_21_14_0_10_59_10]|uniref:ECF transporter S component n=1 Tax=Candidatus Kaiserbacteria bacterium CG10_big_fil_rev_8_21_14_0_10_59_10 TaxID=1974612 RepID=A0A2H0U6U4_9BACT|nr:MAG: hypothetical protein COU20_04025 [Candidatus Kaiserbacteria bacterium CG10_big_fil_rev_8_21_14_0_10_59_10]